MYDLTLSTTATAQLDDDGVEVLVLLRAYSIGALLVRLSLTMGLSHSTVKYKRPQNSVIYAN